MRTKNSWGTVIYDKKRHAYRARYQNPHKPGAVVQRVFSDRLTAQGWLAKEKQLVEADRAGLGSWTHPSEREAEAKARNERTGTVFRDYATEYVENWLRIKDAIMQVVEEHPLPDGSLANRKQVYAAVLAMKS